MPEAREGEIFYAYHIILHIFLKCCTYFIFIRMWRWERRLLLYCFVSWRFEPTPQIHLDYINTLSSTEIQMVTLLKEEKSQELSTCFQDFSPEMMLTIALQRPSLSIRSQNGTRDYLHLHLHRVSASWTTAMDYSSSTRKKEEFSAEIQAPSVPRVRPERSPSNLQFSRLQPSDDEFNEVSRAEFGPFMARPAVLDEEYWIAAWLRAESRWEDGPSNRYLDNSKRKFTEQEFYALKRRCRGQNDKKCTCIVTVRKDEKGLKQTVLKSVVGTLDLSIHYLLQGETFPGERVNAPPFCSISKTGSSKYGYISNLCVAKSARRQGIASNMLHFAVESAKSMGVEKVYVHAHRKNEAAQQLYQKMGFEIVEAASPQLVEDQTYLLCFRI